MSSDLLFVAPSNDSSAADFTTFDNMKDVLKSFVEELLIKFLLNQQFH